MRDTEASMYADRFARIRAIDADHLVDPTIIRALVNCLTDDEVIGGFNELEDEPWSLRRLLIERFVKAAERGYNSTHDKVVKRLLGLLGSGDFRVQQRAGQAIDSMFHVLPRRHRIAAVRTYLQSRYVSCRRRAYRHLRDDPRLGASIDLWGHLRASTDPDALSTFLRIAPDAQIVESSAELERRLKDTWQLAWLYTRLAQANPIHLKELAKLDGVSYAYACAKAKLPIPMNEARGLYRTNKDHKNVGLLLWSFGQLGLWDLLLEIADKPLHEPYASLRD